MDTPNLEVTFILGRLEGKVDSLLVAHSELGAKITAAEARIRVLENYRAYLLGVVAAVSTLISTAVWGLSSFIGA